MSRFRPRPGGEVRINEETLRDGEQTPRVIFLPRDKVAIAAALARALPGRSINAGYPAIGPAEAAVRAVALAVRDAEIECAGRATREDLDRCIACVEGRELPMLSLTERATLLQGVPPFADLSGEQLRLLAQVAEERDIAAGETVVAAGSRGDHLYVIVSGQVALEEQRGARGSVARIGTLGPGAPIGEEAVFDGGIHALSAAAISDCHLLALGREVLLALIEEQPALARALIAWLSARLRETSGKLAERTRPRPRSVIDLLDRMDDGRR